MSRLPPAGTAPTLPSRDTRPSEAFGPVGGSGADTTRSARPDKPAPTPEIRPVVGEVVRTDYDVDLHELKQNETYDSISKQYYQDVRYAAALREFNLRRSDPSRGSVVHIPPIYVLKKSYPSLIGPPRPTTTTPPAAPASRNDMPPLPVRPVETRPGN